METGYDISDYDPASLTFKSYYVVWKLRNKDNYSLLENV